MWFAFFVDIGEPFRLSFDKVTSTHCTNFCDAAFASHKHCLDQKKVKNIARNTKKRISRRVPIEFWNVSDK
jgi:hypothetical protein